MPCRDSGSSVLTDVEVRILSSALYENRGFWSFGWKPLFRYQQKKTKPSQKSIFNRQFRPTHHDTQHRNRLLVLGQTAEQIHNEWPRRLCNVYLRGSSEMPQGHPPLLSLTVRKKQIVRCRLKTRPG